MNEQRLVYKNMESVPSEAHSAESPRETVVGEARVHALEKSTHALESNLRERATRANAHIDAAFNGYRMQSGSGWFLVHDISSLRAAIREAKEKGDGRRQWFAWEKYLEHYNADEQRLKQMKKELHEARAQLPEREHMQTKESLRDLRGQVEKTIRAPENIRESFSVEDVAAFVEDDAYRYDIGHGIRDMVKLYRMYPGIDPNHGVWRALTATPAFIRLMSALEQKKASLSRGERTMQNIGRSLQQAADESWLQRTLGLEESIAPGARIPALKGLRRQASTALRNALRSADESARDSALHEFLLLRDTYSILYRNAYLRARTNFDSGDTRLLIPMRRARLGFNQNDPRVIAMERVRDEYTGITATEGHIDFRHSDILTVRERREADRLLRAMEERVR